jgi:hypothetical protein
MVDFWEVFGRMLTDDDFRGELYRKCQDTPYRIGIEVPGFDNKGLDIAYRKYDAARKIVAEVITDGPVSLMTLGELLMILSCEHFRGLATNLAAKIQNTINTAGGSKLFYIAIGCMMLDGQVLSAFANDVFDDIQFGGLSGLERDALSTLAADPSVFKAASVACHEFWGTACTDTYAYYPAQGRLRDAFAFSRSHHMHPIVQPYPPSNCDSRSGGKGRGKAANKKRS